MEIISLPEREELMSCLSFLNHCVSSVIWNFYHNDRSICHIETDNGNWITPQIHEWCICWISEWVLSNHLFDIVGAWTPCVSISSHKKIIGTEQIRGLRTKDHMPNTIHYLFLHGPWTPLKGANWPIFSPLLPVPTSPAVVSSYCPGSIGAAHLYPGDSADETRS